MGLVARLLEERGIATVCVATGRDLAWLVRPPRTLFVNHPMGNNFGAPGDVTQQTDIVRTALGMIESTTKGGTLIDYPSEWPESFAFRPGGMKPEAGASAG